MYDFALYEETKEITLKIVKKAFGFIGVFKFGLYITQIEYLKVLHEVFNDSYGSLEAISSIVRDDRYTIVNELEPILLLYKLIEKSPRGRKITQAGIEYLNNIKFAL